MQEPTVLAPRPGSRLLRRVVLGTALALAFAAWLAPKIPAVGAQESPPPAPAAQSPAPAAQPPTPPAPPKPADAGKHGVAISIDVKSDSGPAKDADAANGSSAEAQADSGGSTSTRTVTVTKDGERTITVTKNGKTVTLTGVPGDHEFHSFDELVTRQPTIAFMVIGVVAVVFLAPVLAIALFLGYRMRRIRMQNETLLQLAERGALAPGDAVAAVAAGTSPADLASDAGQRAGEASATPGQRVAAVRRRAAWSDLRKGVVMGGIGLGLSLFSILDDQTPNSVGLVLLFVGIGYVVLWWFEERQVGPGNRAGGPPPGSGPGGSL